MLCTLRFRPFPGSTFLSAPPLVGSLSGRLRARLRRDFLQKIIPFIIASSGGLLRAREAVFDSSPGSFPAYSGRGTFRDRRPLLVLTGRPDETRLFGGRRG